MATYDDVLSNTDYILRLTVNQSSQNIANNTSVVSWSLVIIKGSGSGRWSYNGASWSVNIGGQTSSGSISSYDFRNYSSLTLGSGTKTITHNADGTKTIANSASFTENVINIGNGYCSGNLTLTTIPRASTSSFTPNPIEAGQTLTINTNRASTSFTHTLKYSIGAASGTIATGVGASTTWVVPSTLVNQIPNATSGTVTITTETYSGSTLIGTKNSTFTMTVPASVVPTFTATTASENVAAVTTVMGSGVYVQGVSKLNVAITGAAGAGGSTISSYKIEVAGQTINAASGVTGVIASSGTVAVVGTITDSRGRTATKTTNITVLAYAPPVIDAALTFARRASSGGVLQEEGTYIRVDLKATVSSLINSTQRNTLTYRVSTRERGTTTWTVRTTTTPAGISYNSFFTLAAVTFAVDKSWEVLIEVIDKFSTSSLQITVATATVFMHWGDGLGVGKFYQAGRGSMDVLGHIYQNDGLAVLDTSDFASSAEVLSGTSSLKAVTPAALAGSGTYRYVQTVTFTAGGTFTKGTYPWLKAVRVRVQAAGGAGGGAVPAGGGQHSAGGGGGGGGYAEKFILASALASSETVTLGAPGTAVAGGTGTNAASSSFGAHCVATGGQGGSSMSATGLLVQAFSGIGGVGTTGDVLVPGGCGGFGSGYATLGVGGAGGDSFLGAGARQTYTGAGGGNQTGGEGRDYGGGGAGATTNAGAASNYSGGAGAPGIILVDLYA